MTVKSILAAGLFAVAGLVQSTNAEPTQVGVMNFTFDASHRDRLVQSLLFYPAEAGGMPEWIGDNAVFRGVPVRRDAKPEIREHPLIVVSHGSGGNAAGLAWLATRLVQRGFVVAIVNHQGSTSGDSTPETTIPAFWQRPADISQLLDALVASPAANGLVDEQDVTVVGFSLGGAAALSLAGAQFNAAKLAAFCDAQPDAAGCSWLIKGNAAIPGHVDLHKIDARRFNAAHPDPRIGRYVVIDPGYVPAIDTESVKAIAAPMQIINLGSIEEQPAGVRADHLAAALDDVQYDTVNGAIHFDFLSECKRLGWLFIWMEGDDPVCNSGRNRSEVHDEVAQKILGFLLPERT